MHGSTPQELIQVADASMYVSKHQGGNAVSTAEHLDPDEAKRRKHDVLEGYLNVTLKSPLNTGPDALEDICKRLEQFTRSLAATDTRLNGAATGESAPGTIAGLPSGRDRNAHRREEHCRRFDRLDAKDPCTEGHSQKVSSLCGISSRSAGDASADEMEEIRLAAQLS